MKKQTEYKKQRKLFSKCVFTFGREVGSIGQAALQYLILSFGGQFFSADEADDEKIKAKVTHYIMDRPLSDAFYNAN